MPAAVITDKGLKLRLAALLDRPLFVRLYRTDQAVFPLSELGDFGQAAFPGYADAEVTGLWSAPVVDAIGRAFSAVYNVTWTRGAGGVPETIYGWLLYQNPDPSGVLVTGTRLTIPRAVDTAGATVIESIIFYLLRG